MVCLRVLFFPDNRHNHFVFWKHYVLIREILWYILGQEFCLLFDFFSVHQWLLNFIAAHYTLIKVHCQELKWILIHYFSTAPFRRKAFLQRLPEGPSKRRGHDRFISVYTCTFALRQTGGYPPLRRDSRPERNALSDGGSGSLGGSGRFILWISVHNLFFSEIQVLTEK